MTTIHDSSYEDAEFENADSITKCEQTEVGRTNLTVEVANASLGNAKLDYKPQDGWNTNSGDNFSTSNVIYIKSEPQFDNYLDYEGNIKQENESFETHVVLKTGECLNNSSNTDLKVKFESCFGDSSENIKQENGMSSKLCQSEKRSVKKRARKGMKQKLYQCDVCDKFFTDSSNFNRHKRIHSGSKPYKCDVCDRCFTLSFELKRHTFIHTGEKPYQCDVCNKCFSQSNILKCHKYTHTGEKPYQCDICYKNFTLSFDVIRHKLTHTGEKPYECEVCSKCFSQSSGLNTHMITHTGEKPFQCDVCNKCFSHLWNLNKHKLLHTGEKPYECDVCSKCFTDLGSFKRHNRTHMRE